jgi:hypothetical protein
MEEFEDDTPCAISDDAVAFFMAAQSDDSDALGEALGKCDVNLQV